MLSLFIFIQHKRRFDAFLPHMKIPALRTIEGLKIFRRERSALVRARARRMHRFEF